MKYEIQTGKVIQTIFGPRRLYQVMRVSDDGGRAHHLWHIASADAAKTANAPEAGPFGDPP